MFAEKEGRRSSLSPRLCGWGRATEATGPVTFCRATREASVCPARWLLGPGGHASRPRLVFCWIPWTWVVMRRGREAAGQVFRLLVAALFSSADLSSLSPGQASRVDEFLISSGK